MGLHFSILLVLSPQTSTMRNISRMGTKIIYLWLSPVAQSINRRKKSEQKKDWLSMRCLSLLVLADCMGKRKSKAEKSPDRIWNPFKTGPQELMIFLALWSLDHHLVFAYGEERRLRQRLSGMGIGRGKVCSYLCLLALWSGLDEIAFLWASPLLSLAEAWF